MQLSGLSLVGSASAVASGAVFHGLDARSGAHLEPAYSSASLQDVERAAQLAHAAFSRTKGLTGAEKAQFLHTIASRLEAAKAEIVERAALETALPIARLEGEVGRTSSQLRLFAGLVAEGSWVDARIDTADPNRQPLPKPDVRSMLRPLGPVAVFGASNFPLAFSVAGGDSASAFAAGCPVIVKAHPAHPGTSEIVGRLIAEAVRECALPEGTFSLLFDSGHDIGLALVRHPLVKAVGFTGSRRGGVALMEAAAARPEPIPVYAEMSSINPVLISAGALAARATAIAGGLAAAVTLGVGQFCTNPGLVLLPVGPEGDGFTAELTLRLRDTAPGTMLTGGICDAYQQGVTSLSGTHGIATRIAQAAEPGQAIPALFETIIPNLLAHPEAMAEVFGPATLVVRYQNQEEVLTLLNHLEGQLTATLHLEPEELANHSELISRLQDKVGRLILNGYPTGVEVCPAMVHGGPYPATSDGRSTSVGTRAIERFVRPVSFQNFPETLLPAELQDHNPLGIQRLVNGVQE